MTNSIEIDFISELRNEINKVEVGDTFYVSPSSDLCSSLELYIPALLRRNYAEWVMESLDGIFVARAIKTGKNGAKLIGTCILISDQTVAPFLIEMELSITSDALSAVKVMIGEKGGGGRLKISGPPCNSQEARHLLESIADRSGQVRWSYVATSGAARHP